MGSCGDSRTDHPGASSEQDPEKGDTEEDPAFDLRTEFYFCYRSLRYGKNVPFSGGAY